MELVAGVLAAGVALAAWISVVGGAVVWARFASAHISPAHSVALQSRNFLIAEGLRSLLFPLLLAAAAAGVVYVTHNEQAAGLGKGEPRGKRASVARLTIPVWTGVALSAVAIAGVIKEGVSGIHWKPWLELLAITAGTIFVLVLGLARRAPTPRSAALILFAAVALWSGAFLYFTTEGQRHPKLDLARVRLKNVVVVGYVVARTDGDLYVAEPLSITDRKGHVHHGFTIRMFSPEHVRAFSFGPTRRVYADESEAELQRAFHGS